MKFGTFLQTQTAPKSEPKHMSEEYIADMLVNEDNQSFYTAKIDGKTVITTESVKSIVLDKLYKILALRIAKLDADYQNILASKGDYQRYRHFKSTDTCIQQLKELVKNSTGKISKSCITDLQVVFSAHDNLISKSKMFMDAFKYNISPVEQYYLVAVSSVIYSIGYITTSMIDYERRQGSVEYSIIFKNDSMMEKGLPMNMMALLRQFNRDIASGSIEKTVRSMKGRPVGTESFTEMTGCGITTESLLLGITAGVVGILALPGIIRHCIYFFMHSKVKLSEYLENQAYFIELNSRSLKRQGGNDDVAAKEDEYVNKLRDFAAKISTDKYTTEKSVERDLKVENKELVKASDEELKNTNTKAINSDNFDDSDIII